MTSIHESCPACCPITCWWVSCHVDIIKSRPNSSCMLQRRICKHAWVEMHHTHQLVMPFLLMQNPYAQRLSIASKMSMSCFPLCIQIAFIGLVYTYIWHAVYAFSWSCALQLSVLTPVDVPSMCSALDILWGFDGSNCCYYWNPLSHLVCSKICTL